MQPIVITPAETSIVTLAEAKAHLRITQTAEDDYVQGLITLAHSVIEERTRTTLIQSTLRSFYDCFPCGEFNLSYGPISSVTSISYTDTNEAKQSLDLVNLNVDTERTNARIQHKTTWPSTYQKLNAVEVNFIAGYETAANIPQPLKQAALLLIGHFFENREMTQVAKLYTVPFTVEALLKPYTMVRI